jgi:hypothetical protein
MRSIELEKWFGPESKKSKIKCGVEIELPLFDSRNKELLQNNELVERILGNLPNIVYRDHYSWQLEIRTEPSNNPEEIINTVRDLFTKSSKEFYKHKIFVVPATAIARNSGPGLNGVYCGMHVHVSYPDVRVEDYWEKAMGIYPFILALADHSKNFEVSEIQTSERLDKSHHIGMPFMEKSKFMLGNRDSNSKFKDIILSNPINDGSRHRLAKPATIECRIFDTPSLFNFFEYIVRYTMGVASRIKTDNPMVEMIKKDPDETNRKLTMTRDLLATQRYGVNKVFRMLNADVCASVSDYMKIPFPEVTQFEFRENMHLSADVNGYLSMITHGGWI